MMWTCVIVSISSAATGRAAPRTPAAWSSDGSRRSIEQSSRASYRPGAILSLAYPDRIAKNRGGGSGGFVLANGRGGQVDAASNLAREPFLVVAELTGAAASSRIVLAAAITLAEIEERFAGKIEDRDTVTFDAGSASLRARRSRRLGRWS